MELSLDSRSEGSWTVVQAAGELDLHTSPQLRDRVLELTESGTRRIAIDLGGVTFMDSSSLGVLITCLKRVREQDGNLVLVGVNGPPIKVLTLTGLDRVFEMVDSTAELPSG